MSAFASRWFLALLVSAFLVAPSSEASAAPLVVHGRVTSYVTGEPIAGAQLSASYGVAWADAESAADGTYTLSIDIDPIAGTSGYVAADASGYVHASATLDPSGSDIVIDFALRMYGTVSGSVRHAATGLLLDQAQVSALRLNGASWDPAVIDFTVAGAYTLYGVRPAEYRMCAGGLGTGFAQQCFDGFDVHTTADIQSATPVVVTDGAAVAGVDFEIREGAHLRGTVRDDAGLPIANQSLRMEIYDAAGKRLDESSVHTDDAGTYDLDGVPGGTFYVEAAIERGALHGKRLYPAIECPADTCPPATTGEAVVVPAAGVVTGIDFTFRPIATLSGAVVDRSNAAAVVGARVSACQVPIIVWATCFGSDVDVDGHYEIALDIGRYILIAIGPDSHADAVYPDTPCWSFYCMSNDDEPPIEVAEGDALSGFDFALHRSARITGTVTDAATGSPVEADIAMFDANYRALWRVGSDQHGSYATPKWPGGTFYIAAYQGWESRCTFYVDLPCPAQQDDPSGIAAIDPSPVIVGDGETMGGIDLQLPQSAPIFFDGFEASAP